MSDVHYLTVFFSVFFFLGILAPFLNETFDQNLTERDINVLSPEQVKATEQEQADTDVFTNWLSYIFIGLPAIPIGYAVDYVKEHTLIVSLIANIFLTPFWTFGFPTWVNLYVLTIFRVPYAFLLARNFVFTGGKGGGG